MIKFNKYHVTDGTTKASVIYSVDNRTDEKECVTIYANDYSRDLGRIFKDEYVNDTDSMADYFDQGHVTLFSAHPCYALARERALEKPKKKTINLDPDFKKAFDVFLSQCQTIIDIHYLDHESVPVLDFTKGQKYIRVFKKDYSGNSGSVYGFIDITTGNVHKSKGWKTPNKKIRGNIYDSCNGTKHANRFNIG